MKKIGLYLLGIIVLFSLVSMVVSKIIYDGQFPRYERHDETVSANLRYGDLEPDYPRELVDFKSGDNLLKGYVYGSENSLGLVVVAHGLGGGADSYLPQITYFVDHGWRVFAYDATGSFDSEGKTTKGFPQALLDLDAALSYIDSITSFEALPVVLFGHSWGGYAVANVLHFDHEIAGVVSVSGASSAMSMIMEQGERMMGGFIYVQYPYLWLYQRLLFGESVSYDAIEAINKKDIPVLIIHGTEDEMVDYNGSAVIAGIEKVTNPKVETVVQSLPGRNGHNSLFKSETAVAYIEKVNVEYKALYDQYDATIPYGIRQEFYSNIDRSLAQDLDDSLMGEIQRFFLKCIR
jgi:alpha-beta hydrolase superfamily lysophospholipase